MFCQCIFNSEGIITHKASTIDGVTLVSKNITELFKEVGIQDKEWNVGKEYFANHDGRQFRCVATKLGNDFQFVGIDISLENQLKEQLESQQRISDLNLNRLLKTLDKLRDSNIVLEDKLKSKNSFLENYSHKLKTSLNDIFGLLEILEESPEADQKQLLELLKDSSRNLLAASEELL